MHDMIIVASTLLLVALGTDVTASAPAHASDIQQQRSASRTLTPEQRRAALEAEALVEQLTAQADMVEAEQLACDGEWRFAGSAEHPAYMLLIRKLGYTVAPDHGAASSGSVEAVDGSTALLTSDDPLAHHGVEQHFIECRDTDAVVSGRHEKDALLQRVSR